MDASPDTAQAISTQTISQNNQAGFRKAVERILNGQIELARMAVQPVIQVGIFLDHPRRGKTFKQILENLAGDHNNRLLECVFGHINWLDYPGVLKDFEFQRHAMYFS